MLPDPRRWAGTHGQAGTLAAPAGTQRRPCWKLAHRPGCRSCHCREFPGAPAHRSAPATNRWLGEGEGEQAEGGSAGWAQAATPCCPFTAVDHPRLEAPSAAPGDHGGPRSAQRCRGQHPPPPGRQSEPARGRAGRPSCAAMGPHHTLRKVVQGRQRPSNGCPAHTWRSPSPGAPRLQAASQPLRAGPPSLCPSAHLPWRPAPRRPHPLPLPRCSRTASHLQGRQGGGRWPGSCPDLLDRRTPDGPAVACRQAGYNLAARNAQALPPLQPVRGSRFSNVLPDLASTHCPPISSCTEGDGAKTGRGSWAAGRLGCPYGRWRRCSFPRRLCGAGSTLGVMRRSASNARSALLQGRAEASALGGEQDGRGNSGIWARAAGAGACANRGARLWPSCRPPFCAMLPLRLWPRSTPGEPNEGGEGQLQAQERSCSWGRFGPLDGFAVVRKGGEDAPGTGLAAEALRAARMGDERRGSQSLPPALHSPVLLIPSTHRTDTSMSSKGEGQGVFQGKTSEVE